MVSDVTQAEKIAAESPRPLGFWRTFFAALAVMSLMSIGHQLSHIRSALDRNTSLSLCIQAAKLGVADEKCDRLLDRKRP